MMIMPLRSAAFFQSNVQTSESSVVVSQPAGVANVLLSVNKGIEKSTGEYCLFLNSGDFLKDKNVLKEVFSKNYSADIIYGNMLIDLGNDNTIHGKMPEKISFYQMYSDTLWHPVSFIKRNLFSRFGNYDERFKMVADYDFFFRAIIINSVSTQHIDLEISVYNVNGLSSKPEFKKIEKEERLAVLNKYFPPLSYKHLELLAQRLVNNFQFHEFV